MEIGFYGKLPSHGDFLRRQVDDSFVGVWDAWLQQGIEASRIALEDAWLDTYLTSPIWRFVCAPGVCGESVYAGVMAPSVDRVGRYFPLTAVWRVPEAVSMLAVLRGSDRWFDEAEKLLVETLASDDVDFEAFYKRLAETAQWLALAGWRYQVGVDPQDSADIVAASPAPWHMPLGVPPAWHDIFEQLLQAQLQTAYPQMVALWTEGSVAVEPCWLLSSGLPAPHRFPALLDGSWAQHEWQSARASLAPAPTYTDTLVDERVALEFNSAALTDVGRQRSNNQDAFVERPEVGLWAVADGLGGLRDGDVASRMVCDALVEMLPAANLDQAVQDIKARLENVNEYLHRAALRPIDPIQSGSTVAALVARENRAAILWAGDSRVYRWRDGALTQLTFDHSWAARDPASDDTSITRAIGGESELLLDVHFERLRPNDRLLACSDGLTREVSDERIAELLADGDAQHAVRALVDAALEAGGRDNVTVVVVDALPAA